MLLERDPPVNFVEILFDLIRWGWNLTRIAETINVPYSTLATWLYNPSTVPNFENGRALLKLHDEEKKRFADIEARRKALQGSRSLKTEKRTA